LGDSLVYLAVDGDLLGVYVVHDQLRPEAAHTLAAIRALGIERILLATGDQLPTAQYVSGLLGLKEFHAGLLPADKFRLVEEMRASGWHVAMVGDGVNDAQALTSADLSLAMGAGKCDVAIETADVTLARDDLMLVAETLDISRRTLRTIHQNFFFSVSINALGVAFGALGKLSPFAGAIVHNASTIAVVLNSLKLGREVAKANPLSILKEIKL
jgi:cation-transporting P-type ATPase C